MAPKTGNNKSTPALESDQEDDMISQTSRDSKQPTPTENSETGPQEFPDAANPGQEQEVEVKEAEGAGEGEKEAGSSKKKDGGDKGKGKAKEPKEQHNKSVKVNWDNANREKLRSILIGGFVIPNKHKEAISKVFRELPTPKAIAEQIAKERRAGRDLIKDLGLDNVIKLSSGPVKKRPADELDNDDGDAPAPNDGDPGPSRRPSKNRKTNDYNQTGVDPPVVAEDEAVFGGYPVVWSQLPRNLIDQVKRAAEKAAREARLPSLIAMHKKNLAEQREREDEAARKTAEALVGFAGDGGTTNDAGADGSPSRPETEAERQVREQVAELTGSWGSGSKEGGDGESS